jgi:hypothetical protein
VPQHNPTEEAIHRRNISLGSSVRASKTCDSKMALLTINPAVSGHQLHEWYRPLKANWEGRLTSLVPTTSVSLYLVDKKKHNLANLANVGLLLIIGLVTELFFYTMLEGGMALIAVTLPSLHVFSIPIKASKVLDDMRGRLGLSFRHSTSTDIARTD